MAVPHTFGGREPIRRSIRNVQHHYDLPDALYDIFLDPERQYSCGDFRSPDISPEQAQRDKVALIARKLRLEPGMRGPEMGSRWGGLACWLAHEHGVEVTCVTLIREQLLYSFARRAREAGEAGPVRVSRLPAGERELRPRRINRHVRSGRPAELGCPFSAVPRPNGARRPRPPSHHRPRARSGRHRHVHRQVNIPRRLLPCGVRSAATY